MRQMMTPLLAAAMLAGAVLVMPLAGVAEGAETIEWPAYGGAPGGGHHTPAQQITPANVSGLTNVWTHRSGDFVAGTQSLSEDTTAESMRTRPTNFMVTPIMVDDTVYYCTPFNRVFALDPATGVERWSFDPQVDMSKEGITNCRAVSSWQDPHDNQQTCNHRIILGTLDARLIVLDAKTGARCADFGSNGEVSLNAGLTEHEAFEYGITSAPAIIGDTVVTGAFVQDSRRPDIPSGVVRAYNIRTGAFLWGWNPVHPDRPQVDEGVLFYGVGIQYTLTDHRLMRQVITYPALPMSGPPFLLMKTWVW